MLFCLDSIKFPIPIYSSPVHPDQMKWDELYPNMQGRKVEFLDIGCGYGGFLGKSFELIYS